MTELQTLALYSVAILLGAVGGGLLPLLGRLRRSDLLLSFSAGVMLGAAFFHMLPEAVEEGGQKVVPFVLAGFLLLYLLERFVLIHLCAEPAVNAQLAQQCVDESGDHHGHGHGTGTGCEVHTLGLAAWIGMSLHTVVDGFVLGAANAAPTIGPLVFVAIVAHKIPSAFSLSAILRAEGHGRARALAMNVMFGAMIPIGALLYVALRNVVPVSAFSAYALAASAGTFLHLSLSDILPDLHRTRGSKLGLSGALVVGLASMWSLTLLGHGH
jgi:zinc and cadmium transporter